MYTGYKPNSNVNKSISSVNTRNTGNNESQLQTLQKEVDNYTRKLEQQKRRYFSVQQNYKMVLKQFEQHKQKLNQLKKASTNTETSLLHAKIKNLEANLDKAISVYDQTLAYNNKLKGEIDMLRRQKKNFKQIHKNLEEQIKKIEQESMKKEISIEQKKKRTEMLKNQIINVKQRNEEEKNNCMKQFQSLQKNYLDQKKLREAAKLNQKVQKTQTIDTQPVLKMRLKKLIAKNKEKVKVIDQYQKNIKLIEEAFQQIKIGSGITDLQEITNTFIKSEEQNYSLYNYVDILSQNIDNLQQQNKDLQKKIIQQEKQNEERRKQLSGTPDQEKKKKQIQSILKQKQKIIQDLNNLITAIQPQLESTLLQLAKSKFNDDPKKLYDYELGFNINDRNIEQYLSDVEKYINILIELKNSNKVISTSEVTNKEGTKYNNAPTYVIQQIKEQKDLMGEKQLKKFAEQYIEKKKLKQKQ